MSSTHQYYGKTISLLQRRSLQLIGNHPLSLKSHAVFNVYEVNPSLLIFSEPLRKPPVSGTHQYGHTARLKSRTLKLEDIASKSIGINAELLFISKAKICGVYVCEREITLKHQEQLFKIFLWHANQIIPSWKENVETNFHFL